MGQFFQVFFLVIIGVFLLWFGYTLFIGMGSGAEAEGSGILSGKKRKNNLKTSYPGAPQTCPVCSVKLDEGLLVKSIAFPSLNGGKDRFMHIKGCIYCMAGEQERVCPVCNHILIGEEVLICRLFERSHHILQRSHVHVLGCTYCRASKVSGVSVTNFA